ncbi:MAG: phospho-N-acetylmuramoyl-pentapeptide-transferase [Clostridiales bacterium]|uniref:phospho-N-acetylmuramoyl-pentapeptide- transferase n=1 Tax=Terrisporobacter sp. TaxID=1965305 RepID=UPI002A3AFF81|nr:phospho-N-acetylmuramoyl-pentapeptide-transferase [Terrisporobacter sp.]MCI5630447.1 phospho-N-acetylmuramoyl-pentapeptide-transferase [Clostridium sp.]MDD5877806.1 phospho-N-acetylmuramoyl-pentapeptide-transferase [Clostridiales bacterium]MCI6457411.1 phospho-N-acetylmuramoyl-pentapeptide-transferase [Clostridium sp.]MCI7207406.1 phospho-N-acetylmuramoyl-pentapeptide-transferase [Clostridium sp.]MDD7754261.1 phospho-N-acetylmuramoyl-pentapeptide-transferase [Clostridiales bacterium]
MMLEITQLTYTAIIGFLIVVILGPIFIPMLAKFKFGQTVRDDGPQTHLQKNGTPTMGGVIMIIAILITGLTRAKIDKDLLVGLICITGFGFVGFLDDFIKIKMKRSLGLKAYQKIILQFALALFVSYYQYSASPSATQIMIPFTDYIINLGPLYVPIMMFVIIGTVNAVNLTDGLDGLASGITLIVSIFFMLLAISVGNSDVAILAAATGGACLGFLGFNSYPAKVFMGDTGSMALGGAVVSFAVLTNSVLLIPIVGGIYFAEAISVIIQVTSFRLTGKRVFKMAPIHHHFEQCGWPETRVVFVFWIATVVLAWIGIIAVF